MINLEKEIRQQPGVLSGIREANSGVIARLVDEIKKRNVKSVSFAARGTSDHAAIYGQYILGTVVGIPCGLTTPSVVSKYNGKLSFPDTLVIGISQSGMAKDVAELMERARATGAVTVSVTNAPGSPLEKATEFNLRCNAGPETSIAATKTFTSQLCLLTLLAAEWAGDTALLSAVDRLPSYTEELLGYMPGTIDKIVEKFEGIGAATVLGRGFAYPAALEGALKILETNRIKMRGYADSDFMHGPIAQINKGDEVILIALDGAVFDDSAELAERLTGIGAELTVITDTDIFNGMKNTCVLRLPDPIDYAVKDALSVFGAAVTLQLIALELVKHRNIDPDVSEVIKKVTVTE